MNQSFSECIVSERHHSLSSIRQIGIFWDIENCHCPSGVSIIKLVDSIRQYVFAKHFRESEFLVVCDTHRANHDLLDDLNSTQVTVVHISSTAKNAADDKLKQQIVRYIETKGSESALLVLTDDINFATVLSDLRNRLRVEIILFQRQASPALLACANVVVNFTEFCKNLPLRSVSTVKESTLLVQNLPKQGRPLDLKKHLSKLSQNCGGKKIILNLYKSEATIKFSCLTDAQRAQQRIDCSNILGQTISATLLDNPKEVISSESDNSDSSALENKTDIMYKTRQRNHSTPTGIQLNEWMAYCPLHSIKMAKKSWTEYLNSSKPSLPNVNISLPLLSTRVHHLLDTHGGLLPLNSFIDCYIGEFHETFNTTDAPVIPLEHLITCVPGVNISISSTNYIKRISWIQNKDRYFADGSIISEPMTPISDLKLSHFGKEVRELLKSQPMSTIAFNKFVPSYHTHFVRQLCVSSYGFVKLSELLEEIPHIVQIYGENDGRMITLTHREQTKRFATDLIKVLKTQNGRKIKLSEFPNAYQMVFNKKFDICDYGVCYVEDILRDVWEGTVIINPFGTNDQWIEIPKKERNNEQIVRTNNFGAEVVELLVQIPNFELTFSKFIPFYHKYFNKQCRVSDYGFTKLIELLEELSPKYIEIESGDKFGEKLLRLNFDNRLKALLRRFESILKPLDSHSATISDLEKLYLKKYSVQIDYIEYYANDLIDLMGKMPTNTFRITQTRSDTKVILLDKHHLKSIALKVIRILMEESNTEMNVTLLQKTYRQLFGHPLSHDIFTGDMKSLFVLNSKTYSVKLCPMLVFARDCIQLMQTNCNKKFTLNDLESGLMDLFNRPLPQPNNYMCTSFSELFRKLHDYFTVEKRTRGGKLMLFITLNQSLRKNPLNVKTPKIQILKRLNVKESESEECKVLDIMDTDVPESLPAPQLLPNLNGTPEFICLSSKTSEVSDIRSNSPDLMDFNDSGDSSHDMVFDGTLTSFVEDIDCKYTNGFGLSTAFCRKSRIIANLS